MLVVPKPPLSWNKGNLETRLAFGFDLCFSVTSAGLSYAYETILQYHSSIWNCYDKCYSRIGDPCWATLHNDWQRKFNNRAVTIVQCTWNEPSVIQKVSALESFSKRFSQMTFLFPFWIVLVNLHIGKNITWVTYKGHEIYW